MEMFTMKKWTPYHHELVEKSIFSNLRKHKISHAVSVRGTER